MLLLLFSCCCHHRTTVVNQWHLSLCRRIFISVDVVIVLACGRGVLFVCYLCYYWRRLRCPRPDNPREPLTRWCPSQHTIYTAEDMLLPQPPMEMMYFYSFSIAFRCSRIRNRSGGEGIKLLDMSIRYVNNKIKILRLVVKQIALRDVNSSSCRKRRAGPMGPLLTKYVN